ncbi:helix-turn-helix domain-containing protein [Rathayibacter sp. VKM Ac-2857]|nr:helix-turn-helix transcriptional regulator [Rathayibacter sp. VKM Ac-2857]NQX17985.1 helix-turn-helix domain-containing protein [Rathayibacter sp. VKM Ac-2857]
MDSRMEIREFLTSRRNRITPERAGLPDFGGRRRVSGLRREEVALLAGISLEYYVRLERGTATGVSEEILDGVSRALHLDAAERAHLFDLVRAANAGAHPRRRRAVRRPQQVRPLVQQFLDAMEGVPAILQNGRLDIIGANALGAALFSPVFEQRQRPVNLARFVFVDERSPSFFRNWCAVAEQSAALLRAEAARTPHDRNLSDLIGELSTQSESFRRLWGAPDVRDHSTGPKALHHPVVGDLDLDYEVLEFTIDRGVLLVAYSAAPGSRSAESLRLLASWTAPAASIPADLPTPGTVEG